MGSEYEAERRGQYWETSRKAERARAIVNPGYAEPSRGNTKPREIASSTQRAEGVTHRLPEVAQCLRGLT